MDFPIGESAEEGSMDLSSDRPSCWIEVGHEESIIIGDLGDEIVGLIASIGQGGSEHEGVDGDHVGAELFLDVDLEPIVDVDGCEASELSVRSGVWYGRGGG